MHVAACLGVAAPTMAQCSMLVSGCALFCSDRDHSKVEMVIDTDNFGYNYIEMREACKCCYREMVIAWQQFYTYRVFGA